MSFRTSSIFAIALTLTCGALTAGDSVYPVPVQYSSTIPVPHYYLPVTSINHYERVIQLEDESRWTIADSDLHVAMSWRQGDFIVLTQCRGWWSNDYSYYMSNQSNNSYIRVNPLSGPLHSSPFSHHITGLDQNNPRRKVVYLDHKTQWIIHEADHNIVKHWQVNDTIIMAYNDSWFSYYDTLLIDVETNTCVKARRI